MKGEVLVLPAGRLGTVRRTSGHLGKTKEYALTAGLLCFMFSSYLVLVQL